jgi:hypothetical protein
MEHPQLFRLNAHRNAQKTVGHLPESSDEAVSGLAQTKMPEPKEKPQATPKKGNG